MQRLNRRRKLSLRRQLCCLAKYLEHLRVVFGIWQIIADRCVRVDVGADVAEGVKELALVGKNISWVRRRSACRQPFRSSVERLSDLFVSFDDVVELEGIGLNMVQLRARRAGVPGPPVGARR